MRCTAGTTTAAVLTVVAAVLPLQAPAAAAPQVTVRVAPAADGRSGPAVQYWTPPRAPQLENTGAWRAAPILVSGGSAYRNGEFLYQDFLYDDTGNPYPDDPVYRANAADFVELRFKPVAGATAVRITYNTMLDADLVATTLAFGGSDAPREMPHGAGASMPAEIFATVHGATVDVVDAASGGPVEAAGARATVDLARRQVTVLIPHAVFDPRGGDDVRIGAATGLWDASGQAYRRPDPIRPAFYNVAFRYGEDDGRGSAWMDAQQNRALDEGDLSAFYALIDFQKLAGGIDDDMAGHPTGVPASGAMNRIYASHYEPAQGRGIEDNSGAQICGPPDCIPPYAGQLQPYALYVPEKAPPAAGYGVTLMPHPTGGNHNSYYGWPYQRKLAERGSGTLVIGGNGRGPVANYYKYAGVDLFEAWAEVSRGYRVDTGFTGITGYSGGGYGTNRYAAPYPHVFAAAAPLAGRPAAPVGGGCRPNGDTSGAIPGTDMLPMVPALRHVRYFAWHAAGDELNWYACTRRIIDGIDAAGYRYELWTFPYEHVAPVVLNNSYQEVVEWMGDARLERNPAHVTYVLSSTLMHDPEMGLDANRAYWVSGLALREQVDTALGSIDVRSHAFGTGDPPQTDKVTESGVSTDPDAPGGTAPYTREARGWGGVPSTPKRDALDIVARNIATVTVDVARAGVSCRPDLDVDSDGPLEIVLAGCAAADPPAAACGTTPPPAPYRDRHRTSATHLRSVDCAAVRGVVDGYPDNSYRPRSTLRRDQMATFVANAIDAARIGRDLPAATKSPFTDIRGNAHAANIRRLAAAGIVVGRSEREYEPRGHVTRAQMATYLLRAAEYASGLPRASLDSSRQGFDDIEHRHAHFLTVNGAFARGLTAGRSSQRYDGAAAVPRDAMASFMVRLVASTETARTP